METLSVCAKLAWPVLLLALGSCAHWRDPHSYPVIVDIVPNADAAVDRRHAFCFVRGTVAHPSDAFTKHQRHDELARICAQHAVDKGVSMTLAPGATAACVPCKLDWAVAGPNDPNVRAEPKEVSHSWRSRRERHAKQLRLTAFHPDGPVVLEATATTWTDNTAFTDDTAEVLCRALFANFPLRTNGKRYDVALGR